MHHARESSLQSAKRHSAALGARAGGALTTWPHLSLRRIPSGRPFTKGCGAIPVFQTQRPKGISEPSDSEACAKATKRLAFPQWRGSAVTQLGSARSDRARLPVFHLHHVAARADVDAVPLEPPLGVVAERRVEPAQDPAPLHNRDGDLPGLLREDALEVHHEVVELGCELDACGGGRRRGSRSR